MLGTDTSAPYSIDWSNVPAGAYSLTAKATDNSGAAATSTAVSITVNAAATNLSYNSATNRITAAGITYDAAGQTLTDANFRGLQYQYNPEGRMIWSANLDGSNPSTSVYDGLGQRVQTTQAGVTRTFFYDIKGSVVAEYETTGGAGYGVLKRLNVCAGGRLLAVDEVQTNGTKLTSYRMADRQGSTRVLMDAGGAVTSRHDYLPFGEELGAGTGAPGSPTGMRTAAQGYSAADSVRERYADTRLDDATGLDHTLWRKLETRSGRWTTPDPYGSSLQVRDPQSFNRYVYVRNDPVNLVDPTGLDDDDWDPDNVIKTDTWDDSWLNMWLAGLYRGGKDGASDAGPVGDFEPQYPAVTDKDINIVSWAAPFDRFGAQVVQDIKDIANNRQCSDAFKKYGLTIPYDQVLWDNLKIVPLGFLYQDDAARTLGISQELVNSIRNDLSTGVILWGDAAATIRGNVSSIIVVGPSATQEGFGGLRSVLIHELIHSGGRAGSGTGVNGDLTGFDGYKEIQAACGGKSN